MQKRNKKILFISHDASFTGAPIVFLHQINWLNRNCSIEPHFLLLKSGPMHDRFVSLAPTIMWDNSVLTRRNSLVSRILRKLFSFESNRILRNLDKHQFDLIYSNTVVTHHAAAFLKKRWNIPWISHIHEMPLSIRSFFYDSMKRGVIDEANKIVAVSKLCSEQLTAEFQIPKDKLEIIYECVPIDQFNAPNTPKEDVIAMLNAEDRFIVGGCGMYGWRKGVDLFIQLSRRVIEMKPNSKSLFVWVGQIPREFSEGYLYEAELLGHEPRVVFTGQTSDAASFFNVFDVFTLTSREDPFPLVALENAAMANPILCFQNAGGIPELIEKNGGVAFPYHDINAMAKQIIEWEEQPEIIKQVGLMAQNEVKRFDVSVIAPKIQCVMEDVLACSLNRIRTDADD